MSVSVWNRLTPWLLRIWPLGLFLWRLFDSTQKYWPNDMLLTFVVLVRVVYIVHFLWQNDWDEYHVADGKVRQKYIRDRSQRLDLHNDDYNAHVAKETKNDKRRDEDYEYYLAVRQTHCANLSGLPKTSQMCYSLTCPSCMSVSMTSIREKNCLTKTSIQSLFVIRLQVAESAAGVDSRDPATDCFYEVIPNEMEICGYIHRPCNPQPHNHDLPRYHHRRILCLFDEGSNGKSMRW